MASAGQWRKALRAGLGRVGEGALTTGSRAESRRKWFMDEEGISAPGAYHRRVLRVFRNGRRNRN